MAKTVVCVDAHGKEYAVPLNELEWRPSVYAIIIRDGKILLSKQFDGYELPGGGMEIGEMPEETAVRETKEETGIIVESPRLIGLASNFFKMPNIHRDDHFVHSILMYYKCDFVGGSLSIDGFDEHEKTFADMPEWIPIKQLDDLNISSSIDYRKYVKQALEQ
jgi:8-oxo-dGTP diphosphatase